MERFSICSGCLARILDLLKT